MRAECFSTSLFSSSDNSEIKIGMKLVTEMMLDQGIPGTFSERQLGEVLTGHMIPVTR